ncbi:MAG: prepilin-type N-terminal cleavage/methylation domain-containing protein [Candidatus Sumerlaeia bacterium]|nr:prepilin-type N-terminal cleavage/methylation domain-containing protein [Candidatus Sumerlaeia bacterium]
MQRRAFTLIELLIVVAIIAILAAIAVPNFLEAQVRSKVSRQLSNMRTVVTAMEAYAVDNNKYPYWTDTVSPRPSGVNYSANEIWKFYPGYPGQGFAGGLTTPIAYISGIDALQDIFRLPHNFPQPLANQIMFLSTEYYASVPATYTAQDRRYGKWVIRSAGPDTYYQNHHDMLGDYGAGGWNRASYDPTNGTVSAGDIYRSQKRPDEAHVGP